MLGRMLTHIKDTMRAMCLLLKYFLRWGNRVRRLQNRSLFIYKLLVRLLGNIFPNFLGKISTHSIGKSD